MTEENYTLTTKNMERSRNIEYIAVEELLYSEELSRVYVSYGIKAVSGGETLALISDISTVRTEVEELVRKCNKYSLDPIHLIDVIEDFLAE